MTDPRPVPTAPFGPAATAGWNWSVGVPAASRLSLTLTGADQVVPPSLVFTSLTPVPFQAAMYPTREFRRWIADNVTTGALPGVDGTIETLGVAEAAA